MNEDSVYYIESSNGMLGNLNTTKIHIDLRIH